MTTGVRPRQLTSIGDRPRPPTSTGVRQPLIIGAHLRRLMITGVPRLPHPLGITSRRPTSLRPPGTTTHRPRLRLTPTHLLLNPGSIPHHHHHHTHLLRPTRLVTLPQVVAKRLSMSRVALP